MLLSYAMNLLNVSFSLQLFLLFFFIAEENHFSAFIYSLRELSRFFLIISSSRFTILSCLLESFLTTGLGHLLLLLGLLLGRDHLRFLCALFVTITRVTSLTKSAGVDNLVRRSATRYWLFVEVLRSCYNFSFHIFFNPLEVINNNLFLLFFLTGSKSFYIFHWFNLSETEWSICIFLSH